MSDCKKYEHFDADGWLSYNDAYCLNCLKENCPNKPKTEKKYLKNKRKEIIWN